VTTTKWKFVSLATCALVLTAVSASAQDWPQWRGPNRDNTLVGFKVPKVWPKELTKQWSVTVGEGVSSPVLVAGKVYVFSSQGGEEVTTCLDADSGKQLWQDKYAAKPVTGVAAGKKKEFVGVRSTPAVAEGKVCTLGVNGVVSCFDAANGNVVWRFDAMKKPQYFTSSSPLITEGKCIVYADDLTAFNLADGTAMWKWAGGGIPYGSPVLTTLDGVKQIVTPSQGSVAGVNLADGKELWKFSVGGKAFQNTYATPIIDGHTVIYACYTSYTAGIFVAYKIEKKGDAFEASELWKIKDMPYLYNTPVLKDGLLFGLSLSKFFYCMEAKTGKEVWRDSTLRGEAGAVLDAGSVLLALTGDSELVAFEPSNKAYVEVAKYKVSPTLGYTYPIISGNRIYVRGSKELTLWTMD
jgi:outer membrane protein assembly factor BamB